jgi:hypothetical protein
MIKITLIFYAIFLFDKSHLLIFIYAVSRRLPTAPARVQIRVWSCGIFVMDKSSAAAGFLSENFGFPCQSTFHLLLHNHLHYHPRLAQYGRSGRSANSLTNQIRKYLFIRVFFFVEI